MDEIPDFRELETSYSNRDKDYAEVRSETLKALKMLHERVNKKNVATEITYVFDREMAIEAGEVVRQEMLDALKKKSTGSVDVLYKLNAERTVIVACKVVYDPRKK